MRRHLFLVALLVLASFGIASAQGVQSGTIAGNLKSSDGQPLPGATVSVKSPALQGVRTAVSDSNGGYIFKNLPPGAYTVTFELTGMTTIEKKTQLELGASINLDAALSVAAVQETVTVTAEAPSVLQQTTVGANYKNEVIDSLATGRTLAGIAELAPGLTDNTPNAGQVIIAGGFAYDNVFLVDGVDVNDNLFGTANNLFIEDAVEETQVLTSGISAEYGRFGGGVINAVTKRGGNAFSGSFRVNFTNSEWTDETPYEKDRNITRKGTTDKTYEATLGGPVVKDRLWFFGAGRWAKTSTQGTYPDLGEAVTSLQDNSRYIAKLTATLAQNHTLQGNYTYNGTDQSQPTFSITASSGLRSIDPRTYYTRSLPNSLFGINYNGVLSSNLFVEAQYSEKSFQFKDSGGKGTNLQDDSPFFTLGVTTPAAGHYNAPYFDANDPEDRNNRQITGNLSYFLSTQGFGRHDLKIGYENFRTTRTGGNSQSPTNYVFYADYLQAGGRPVISNGRYQPVWVTGDNLRINWVATKGAEQNITTQSVFVNDKWQINGNFSANLGARFEAVNSEASGNITAIDTNTIVPRLAVAWDVKGDGKYKLDATYAHYAGKYNDTQVGANSSVGNPAYLYQLYVGPSGVGPNFAPAFDPTNWVTFAGGIPTANIFVDKGLHSPVTREFTFSAGVALPKGGYIKGIFTNRDTKNFIENVIDTTTGSTTVDFEGVQVGPFDNVVYRNSDLPTRKYQGLQFQANYRLTDRWSVQGHYTYQLKNEGDFEGEARNQPGLSSLWLNYPELFVQSRNFPSGNLANYQKHKVRAWTVYDLGLGKAGTASFSLLWRYDSPLTYSLTAASVPFSSIQLSRIAGKGYQSPPINQTIYFGTRGENYFDSTHVFDFALNYSVPVYKSLRPWFKFEVVNLLNTDKLISWNTSVSRDRNGPVDSNGIPTNYIKGANFGKATSTANFETPRTIRFALGFRF